MDVMRRCGVFLVYCGQIRHAIYIHTYLYIHRSRENVFPFQKPLFLFSLFANSVSYPKISKITRFVVVLFSLFPGLHNSSMLDFHFLFILV